jgi:hypothetical protein
LNSNIHSRFEMAARRKSKIQLLNSYKGLPITSEAIITRVDSELIHIQCELQQMACLYLEKQTFLKGEDLDGTIQGQLFKMDPSRQEAALYNFGKVKGDIGQRAQVRVEPEAPVTVLLQVGYHSSAVKAGLVDISINGVGVYLDRILVNPRLYSVGATLNIQFTLPAPTSAPPIQSNRTGSLSSGSNDPGARYSRDDLRGLKSTGMLSEPEAKRPIQSTASKSPVIISAHGMVEYCFSAPPYSQYRLGVSLERSDTYRAIIAPYIAGRQADIIREFRGVYMNLSGK